LAGAGSLLDSAAGLTGCAAAPGLPGLPGLPGVTIRNWHFLQASRSCRFGVGTRSTAVASAATPGSPSSGRIRDTRPNSRARVTAVTANAAIERAVARDALAGRVAGLVDTAVGRTRATAGQHACPIAIVADVAGVTIAVAKTSVVSAIIQRATAERRDRAQDHRRNDSSLHVTHVTQT
jgi:hypothetical protein